MKNAKTITRAVVAAIAVATAIAFPTSVIAQTYPVDSGTLAVSDTEVAPGDSVTVSGGGFSAGGSVSIFFRSDPVLLDTVDADSQGEITATVEIPAAAAPGSHTLEARGPAAAGGTLVLTHSVEVLGTTVSNRSGSGLPNTGMPLVALALAGAAAAGAGAFLVRADRRSRRRAE